MKRDIKDIRELNIENLDKVSGGLTEEEEEGIREMIRHCQENHVDFYELVKALSKTLEENGVCELWSYEKLNFLIQEIFRLSLK